MRIGDRTLWVWGDSYVLRMAWGYPVRQPDADVVVLGPVRTFLGGIEGFELEPNMPLPIPRRWTNQDGVPAQQMTLAEAVRTFTAEQLPDELTDPEIVDRALEEAGRKVASLGTDLPPFGHRTLGDAHFTHDTTLPEGYLHYENLTIGVAPEEGVAPTLVRVKPPPGGVYMVVQNLIQVHPGGHLMGDGLGAPGGEAGGWDGQPAEDWPSLGKMQELHRFLDRIGFHYTDRGRMARPIGGGGGGYATEPGREGFAYCGAGGWGYGLTAGGRGNPQPGGAFLAIACREIQNQGLISSRGLSVAAGDNGGCGGGGALSLQFERGEPGRYDLRGGRLPGNPGTHRDGIDGDAVILRLPQSRHLMY